MAVLAGGAFGFVFYLTKRPTDVAATVSAKPVPAIDLEPVEWSTGKTAGAYVELRIAEAGDHPERIDFDHWRPGAHYLNETAITLLKVPFAEAHPGFSEYMPMLLPPAELRALVASLRQWKEEWLAFATLADVHERWDKLCPFVRTIRSPSDWQRVRDTFVKTINALTAYVSVAAGKNESVWFLGF
jgi:hypothetical protein